MIPQLCALSSPAFTPLARNCLTSSQFWSHSMRPNPPTMGTSLSANISAAIDLWMERSGKTQAALADSVGVHESTISLWASGKRMPGMMNLERLAKAMDLEAKDLWSGPEAMPATAAQRAVLEDMSQLDLTQQEAVAALVRSMKAKTAP